MELLNSFEKCCEYLGISSEIPIFQIERAKMGSIYRLQVAMKAWNIADGHNPEELGTRIFSVPTSHLGYSPRFRYRVCALSDPKPRLEVSDYEYEYDSGVVKVTVWDGSRYEMINAGLGLSFKTRERAKEFGRVFLSDFRNILTTEGFFFDD